MREANQRTTNGLRPEPTAGRAEAETRYDEPLVLLEQITREELTVPGLDQ